MPSKRTGRVVRPDEPKPHLVWLDTETTGIDPVSGSLLEVAAVITSVDLTPVAPNPGFHPEFHQVLEWRGDINDVHSTVVEMHTTNGLWQATQTAEAVSSSVADQRLAAWLDRAVEDTHAERLTLAGATPTFDMAWIAHHLPESHKRLHYRLFDVSTLRQAALWWSNDTLAADNSDPATHRALDDVRYALRMARTARLLHLAAEQQHGEPF